MENLARVRSLAAVACLGWFSAFAGAQGRPALLVVNQGNATVSIVNPATSRQVAVVPEGVTGVHAHEAAVSPDGRTAYLPIYGSTGVGKPGIDGHEMLVIDMATRKIVNHVDFGHGVRPHCAIYDRNSGQLLTGSLMDYAMPRADDLPSFQVATKVTPCTHNPLGAKGCGEAGAIAAPAALMNAVLDALAAKGITHFDMPASPHRVWSALQAAQ